MAQLSICLASFVVVVLGGVFSAVAGPLGDAAKAGDVAELERLLNQGADVNESGLASPLFYAIQYSHTDAARALIERGADVNKASAWGTPIHEGAKHGNGEIVALLLERGADPHVKASKGMTPLHTAAMGGSVEVARLLIEHGGDVNALTTVEEPPIHYARLNGHEAVAQLLMDYGWAPPEVAPISDLLASADLAKGELGAKGCTGGCHTLEEDKIGSGDGAAPSLWNVVGRPKASVSNYKYSFAFSALEGTWTFEALNAYLAHPAQVVPGNKMLDVRGISDIHERADLIAYLRTLSDDPVPLP